MAGRANFKLIYGIWGMLLFMLFVPLVLLVVTQRTQEVPLGTSGIYQEAEVKAAAEKILELYEEGSYQMILEEYAVEGSCSEDNATRMEVEADVIKADWKNRGEVTYIKLSELKKMKDYFVNVQLYAEYGEIVVNFSMFFDSELKLTGMKVF